MIKYTYTQWRQVFLPEELQPDCSVPEQLSFGSRLLLHFGILMPTLYSLPNHYHRMAWIALLLINKKAVPFMKSHVIALTSPTWLV